MSASGFSAMAVWTAAICEGASAAASSARNSMSSYLAACSLAKRLIAARKPWSATGPEKRILTFWPLAGVAPPALLLVLEEPPDADEVVSDVGLLDVQPAVTAALAARSAAARVRRLGRVGVRVLRGVRASPGL